MSTSTSSAIPNDLSTYSRIALTLDGDIAADAGRLAGAISRFESTCRESSFRVPAGHMPPVMDRFARDAEPTDRWVNTVASGFLAADSGGLRAGVDLQIPRASLIPPGAGWLPWPPPSWLPIIGDRDEGATRVTPLPIVTDPLEPPVFMVEWKQPAWLFVPAWIWMLLPIRIWGQLPWFAALGAIFGFRPIALSLPWLSRLWRPIVGWFPALPWINRGKSGNLGVLPKSKELDKNDEATSEEPSATEDGSLGLTPDSQNDEASQSQHENLVEADSDEDISQEEALTRLKAQSAMSSMWSSKIEAPITSDIEHRDPNDYARVIDQFDVEHSFSERYRPSERYPDTRCNVFAADVMKAMGVVMPTKGDLGVGASGSETTDPMWANAKDTYDWLNSEVARKEGWRMVDPTTPEGHAILVDHVNSGKPAVASDPGRSPAPGHIAVIRPNQQGTSVADLLIAQAGATNANSESLGKLGYGSSFRPQFYIHD